MFNYSKDALGGGGGSASYGITGPAELGSKRPPEDPERWIASPGKPGKGAPHTPGGQGGKRAGHTPPSVVSLGLRCGVG